MSIRNGDLLRDNDPRMPNRKLMVVGVDGGKVVAVDITGRRFKFSPKRIYSDGKPRRSGLSVVLESRIPR